MMPLTKTLLCTLRWSHPRRWCEETLELPALTGSAPGTLILHTEGNIPQAELSYPLVRTWRYGEAAGAGDVAAQRAGLFALALVLDVVIGAPTDTAYAEYETEFGTRCFLGPIKPQRALWDWPQQGCDLLPPALLADSVGAAPSTPPDALPRLAEAMAIANPVARYICVWQALAFHMGFDSPRRLDKEFFVPMGVPLDCIGNRGTPWTKYADFRNTLSHPRKADSYEELDARARELADDLAVLILRGLLASSGHNTAAAAAVGLTSAST